MDRKTGLLNISVSLISKVLILFFTIITRRLIIMHVGNEINGINSLYTSIIGFLSVAELGVGAAIAFSMYSPIVNNDIDKVAALYQLYKKMYYIVATVIAVGGIVVMPFLPLLAKDYSYSGFKLYGTFLLAVTSVVITYLYSAKTSLINAFKNTYITAIIHCVGLVVQSTLQIIVLVVFKSFVLYLIATIIGAVLQWTLSYFISKKKYPLIVKAEKKQLDSQTKKEVVKNIKAMFMHKIGNVLVNTVDSIIISAFIGVVILGKYSNYTVIATGLISILSLMFSSMTSIVGHKFVKESADKLSGHYDFFYYTNYLVAFLFFLGYYAIINQLIQILFGSNLFLSGVAIKCITLNYFIQFMRQSTLLFRDASGVFYNDRWKPILEGVFNLILSLLFVNILPEEYNVAGVIIATIITNLCICHIVEPFILYKHAIHESPRKHYIRNYLLIFVFSIVLFGFDFIAINFDNQWMKLLVNGSIAVALWGIVFLLFMVGNKKYRKKVLSIIKRR